MVRRLRAFASKEFKGKGEIENGVPAKEKDVAEDETVLDGRETDKEASRQKTSCRRRVLSKGFIVLDLLSFPSRELNTKVLCSIMHANPL